MTSNTFKIRVDPKKWKKVEKILPGMSNKARVNHLIDKSVPGVEIALSKYSKEVHKLGEFIYGKKLWKKQKR